MNFLCPGIVSVHTFVLMLRSSCEQICSEPFFVLLGCRKACHLLADPIFERTVHYSSKTWCWNLDSFQIFKIHFITAVVLCLGGGIGEISSHIESFDVNARIFAVFERQWNKCSPVATTSSPSLYALLRDPLEAVTLSTVLEMMSSYSWVVRPWRPHRYEGP